MYAYLWLLFDPLITVHAVAVLGVLFEIEVVYKRQVIFFFFFVLFFFKQKTAYEI